MVLWVNNTGSKTVTLRAETLSNWLNTTFSLEIVYMLNGQKGTKKADGVFGGVGDWNTFDYTFDCDELLAFYAVKKGSTVYNFTASVIWSIGTDTGLNFKPLFLFGSGAIGTNTASGSGSLITHFTDAKGILLKEEALTVSGGNLGTPTSDALLFNSISKISGVLGCTGASTGNVLRVCSRIGTGADRIHGLIKFDTTGAGNIIFSFDKDRSINISETGFIATHLSEVNPSIEDDFKLYLTNPGTVVTITSATVAGIAPTMKKG